MFFRPTYPNFFAFEAGNRVIIFFGLSNVVNFEVLYTIYCNLGQFALFFFIRFVDYKRKLSQFTINRIQYV
jgi:hypothetical protein